MPALSTRLMPMLVTCLVGDCMLFKAHDTGMDNDSYFKAKVTVDMLLSTRPLVVLEYHTCSTYCTYTATPHAYMHACTCAHMHVLDAVDTISTGCSIDAQCRQQALSKYRYWHHCLLALTASGALHSRHAYMHYIYICHIMR